MRRAFIALGWALVGSLGAGCRRAPAAVAPTRADVAVGQDLVAAWLDRAETAPHNGVNPQLELPSALVVEGRVAFERAASVGPTRRRHHAAVALSQHPNPREVRPFWREHLRGGDGTLLLWAVSELAELHDPADLDLVLRVLARWPSTGALCAVHLRAWPDRRSVPAVASLLTSDDASTRANAAHTLARLPGVPTLEPEVVGEPHATHLPSGAWRAPERSLVGPYQRWWQRAGAAAFAPEIAAWDRLRADAAR